MTSKIQISLAPLTKQLIELQAALDALSCALHRIELEAAIEALREVVKPNTPGHVHERTGRVAITIEQALKRVDVDRPSYLFTQSAEEYGLDPWRMIDGLDPHVEGDRVDVWFANGVMTMMRRDECIYISKQEAAAGAFSD